MTFWMLPGLWHAMGPPMSIDVGPRKFEAEKAAIDEAYVDHVKKLFEVYYIGRATLAGDSEHNDKEALLKFKSNVETLRRARVHALSVFSEHDI